MDAVDKRFGTGIDGAMPPSAQPVEPMIPPWGSHQHWREANDAVSALLDQCGDRIANALPLTRQIKACIQALDRPMAALCRSACPDCMDPCCRRATVWYDFKDLVYLHLAGEPIPPGQIAATSHDACIYLRSGGCTLARTLRPFVCTWYLCPEQTRLMNQWTKVQRETISHTLAVIKTNRLLIEGIVLQAVVDGGIGWNRHHVDKVS